MPGMSLSLWNPLKLLEALKTIPHTYFSLSSNIISFLCFHSSQRTKQGSSFQEKNPLFQFIKEMSID